VATDELDLTAEGAGQPALGSRLRPTGATQGGQGHECERPGRRDRLNRLSRSRIGTASHSAMSPRDGPMPRPAAR
jgi:hypothetical protein